MNNYKTIKTSTGYVTVDLDASINDGDKVFVPDYPQSYWEFRAPPCPMPYWGNKNTCHKIIISYPKLEGVPEYESLPIHLHITKECSKCGDTFKWINGEPTATQCINCGGELLKVESLSIDDVEKLWEKESEGRYPVKTHSKPENSPYKGIKETFKHGCRFGYKIASKQKGFFTDEDIRYIVQHIKNLLCIKSIDEVSEAECVEHLHSLKQSEWEFEIAMEDYEGEYNAKDKSYWQERPKIINNKIQGTWKQK